MSYNVAVVSPPVPADDQAAWQLLDSLIDQRGPTPAVLHALIDRLTARYPCLCDLPDDQIDDGVWSDGPLRTNLGYRAAVLGMVYSRVEEVLPFQVETANTLGLTVFGWQEGQIHRP